MIATVDSGFRNCDEIVPREPNIPLINNNVMNDTSSEEYSRPAAISSRSVKIFIDSI